MNNRAKILEISYKAKACHIGSALSVIRLLERLNKKDGIIVFSKASGIAALYCIKYDTKTALRALKTHPVGLGSLGHGLPIAVGMALADRKVNIFCVMGDAELQEGTTWECLLFKKQHKLRNLHVYVDNNGFQACGKTKDILELPWRFLKKNGFTVVKTTKGEGVSFMENNNNYHYLNLTEETYAKALSEVI